MRNKWVDNRLLPILNPNETILFESGGRIEHKPPSGIGAIFFWVSYILKNYIAMIVSARYINNAHLIITDKRVIILGNINWKFPLWSIDMSYEHQNYVIKKEQLSSMSIFESRAFWVISSKGLLLESTGSLSMIFNGIKKEDYNDLINFTKNNI